MTKTLRRYQTICAAIGRTLGRKIIEETKMKFYKITAVPTLYMVLNQGHQYKKDHLYIQSAEMTFMKYVRGYTKGNKTRNETVRSVLY